MTDSKIWTNAASGGDPFAHLVIPDDLDILSAEARKSSRDAMMQRTKRFRAKASHGLLSRLVYRARSRR